MHKLACVSAALLIGIVFTAALSASVLNELTSAEIQPSSPTLQVVWPISGQPRPDQPQSSAYGPRLMASENSRYDYHQGIDLPTPLSTTLVAVMMGTVRIAGENPAYSDSVVQLDHGNNLYSNYLHVAASLVVTGQVVAPGQPVALSGTAESGFPHLHFEIRAGSVLRQDAVNPWRYLPYTDTVRHTISITGVTSVNTVWVWVTTPTDELDINHVTVTVRNALTQQILDSASLDYEERNRQYAGDPEQLDNPDLDNILIQPAPYTTTSLIYGVTIAFHHLAGSGPVKVDACAIDVHNNAICTKASGEFGAQVYLPLILNKAN